MTHELYVELARSSMLARKWLKGLSHEDHQELTALELEYKRASAKGDFEKLETMALILPDWIEERGGQRSWWNYIHVRTKIVTERKKTWLRK